MHKRTMVLTGKKMTFAEAEEEEIFQWQNIPFQDKWESLERLRKGFYEMHKIPFPQTMERIIKKVVNGVSE